jgi:GntR family transcriptional regulator
MSVPRELFQIDRQSKLPLYDQIERNLRELIMAGRLKTGTTVPSEWELAELYGVSRLTVRKALDELVRQHWLSKRHGVGTFVTKPSVASIAPGKLSFTNQMKAIGRRPRSLLVHSGVENPNPEVASSLSLTPGEQVYCLRRVRRADDIPILLETTTLALARFPGIEQTEWLPESSLYKHLFETYGVNIIRLEQTLKPVLLDEEQAIYLETNPGTPSIHSLIIGYTSEGEAVEYTTSVSNGEHSEFYFAFKREDL